jgi:hypothetical protein
VTRSRNDLSAPVRATTPWSGPAPVGLELEGDALWARWPRRSGHGQVSQLLTVRDGPSVRVVEATDADLAAIRAAGYAVADARPARPLLPEPDGGGGGESPTEPGPPAHRETA